MRKALSEVKKINKIVWIVIAVLVVIRLALPEIAKYSINWYLGNKIENYQGHIEDFDLTLWRGAYQIQGLRIWKKNTDKSDPLLKVGNIDLSLAWRALFHKELLGDLKIDQLELTFRDSKSEKKKQLGNDQKGWGDVAHKLIPINIESLIVSNSVVHFVNKDMKVPMDMYIDQINGEARNLRNTNESKELLPSPLKVSGRVLSSTPFLVEGRVNLLNPVPVFDIQADLKKLPLVKLNPMFMVYGPFSFEKGTFTMYTEVAANEKKIKGYIKPFLEDVKMTSPHEHYQSFRQALNEFLLGGGNLIFRNSDKKAATRIDFEGDMAAPGVHKWRAVWLSVKNAFGQPIREAIDRNINIKDVPKAQKTP